jgi:Flp pilus assembly CpaF family ATPase
MTSIETLSGLPHLEPLPAVDWALVRRLRRAVAERLTKELPTVSGGAALSAADVRMLGRSLIAAELADYVTGEVRAGRPTPSLAAEDALADAVFAAIFGLGRLQPLIDDPQVENIDVDGHDQVWISYADGRLEPGPAVADSDADLVETLQSYAAYTAAGGSGREFSTAQPLLNLRLPDGSRLAAWVGLSTRPGLTIRRHRLADVTLTDLQKLGTVDAALVGFLAAAVRARKNIVVTGGLNAGKTTLLRALAAEFDRHEKIVVLEKEAELGLDRLSDRHRRVVALEAREANAEGAGEISLSVLMIHALRMNARRILVGEVRGDELIPMLTAMGSGNPGSLCTLHANTSAAAVSRMVAIGLTSAHRLPAEATHALIADAVDFIVHLDLVDPQLAAGRRVVASVREICELGEGGRVTSNEIFTPGPDGRARLAVDPRCLPELVAAGLDPKLLHRPGGWWNPPTQGPAHAELGLRWVG